VVMHKAQIAYSMLAVAIATQYDGGHNQLLASWLATDVELVFEALDEITVRLLTGGLFSPAIDVGKLKTALVPCTNSIYPYSSI
jgi:hypothetical protein